MLIHLIGAARPNFMKIAPLFHALKKESWEFPVIVHTGQHYDPNMSESFFQDLGMPKPDIYLGIGSGSHAEQTAKVMIAHERVLVENKPDLSIVVGDVNSTVAATLAASKLGVKVAHLEAGLRSFDRSMPEEINRLVADILADILWTPSQMQTTICCMKEFLRIESNLVTIQRKEEKDVQRKKKSLTWFFSKIRILFLPHRSFT